MKKRREYSPEYKAKIVLEILKEESTIGEIAFREKISVNQLGNWRRDFLENAERVFAQNSLEKEAEKRIKELEEMERKYQAKVGQLTLEVDFLKGAHKKLFGTEWDNKVSFKK